MALKRQHDMMAAFSMASMTDVIFLLLIFFMVTSTFVFPNALEVNLPQSSQQTAIKPGTRVYIDSDLNLYASFGEESPAPVSADALPAFLRLAHEQAPESYIALYADKWNSLTWERPTALKWYWPQLPHRDLKPTDRDGWTALATKR